MGTGSGVLALLATRAGAQVTAVDLPGAPLATVAANARAHQLAVPELVESDLFQALPGRRFHHILFNPPFHRGTPRRPSDRNYLGGPGGEVVRGFLAQASTHLEPAGCVWLVLPRIEQEVYRADLRPWRREVVARLHNPMLGAVELLRLERPESG